MARRANHHFQKHQKEMARKAKKEERKKRKEDEISNKVQKEE
jgi:hypothetical protein